MAVVDEACDGDVPVVLACAREQDPNEFTGFAGNATATTVGAACSKWWDPLACAFFSPCAPPRALVVDGTYDDG